MVDASDCVVLLCDVQEYFQKVVPDWEKMCASIELVLNSSKALDIPIITTEQAPKVFGNTIPLLKKHLSKTDLVITKSQFSMLVPEVKDEMKKLKRKTIILVGLECHICILQTCLDLLAAGYEVYLPTDAIGSQRSEDRTRALARLDKSGASLTTAESVVFQWVRDAKKPEFKKIQPAIKKFSSESRKLRT